MSGKLDQSLEEITSATKRNNVAGRRRNPRRNAGRPAAPAAPVGGVKKNTKPARGAGKAVPAKAAPVGGDSKIIVSNLPKDVTENQIKDYFNKSVGGIKRVEISYGPNSQSRGIANITFNNANGASTAFSKLNGLLVDKRPIKIEIVVGAGQASKVINPAKSLAERATLPKAQAKAQPKSAANDKKKGTNANVAAGKAGAAAAGRGGRRGGRNARPAKKTAEELDSEMADYFTTDAAAAAAPVAATTAAPAAAAPAGGDAAMDEIM